MTNLPTTDEITRTALISATEELLRRCTPPEVAFLDKIYPDGWRNATVSDLRSVYGLVCRTVDGRPEPEPDSESRIESAARRVMAELERMGEEYEGIAHVNYAADAISDNPEEACARLARAALGVSP